MPPSSNPEHARAPFPLAPVAWLAVSHRERRRCPIGAIFVPAWSVISQVTRDKGGGPPILRRRAPHIWRPPEEPAARALLSMGRCAVEGGAGCPGDRCVAAGPEGAGGR